MSIKSYLKKKYAEQKKEWAEEREFQKKLAKTGKKTHREAVLKEKIRIAKASAKFDADAKLKKYKEKLQRKSKPRSDKDFFGDITAGLPS